MEAMSKIDTPIKLTFTNLTYEVRVLNKDKLKAKASGTVPKYRDEVILKQASGYMLPG